jgi:hypothetical protein
VTDLRQAPHVARAIAVAALGRDPGPLATTESISHHVYIGSDTVVKIIDAVSHSRLDRKSHSRHGYPRHHGSAAGQRDLPLDGRQVRYACYARAPGTTLGMGMPGVDTATARSLAALAVQRLNALHGWTPTGHAE